MFRRLLMPAPPRPSKFRWRGKDVTRSEALTDAVFGFALTLLMVSLEVPRTSGEVLQVMRGFVPFAAMFGFMVLIWLLHFQFFRQYGLEDNTILGLNVVLLFLVLFFVYPFKFLVVLMSSGSRRARVQLPDGSTVPMMNPEHEVWLWAGYGLGLSAIAIVFLLMFLHAYRQRETLALNAYETFMTINTVTSCAAAAAVGVMTVLSKVAHRLSDGTAYEGIVNAASLTWSLATIVGMLAWTRWLLKQGRALAAAAPES